MAAQRTTVVDLVAVRDARTRLDALVQASPELCGEPGAVDRIIEALTTEESVATQQVGFRLPEDLLERVDEFAERMKENSPGMTVTRADAVRVLLTKALDDEDGGARKRTAKRGGK